MLGLLVLVVSAQTSWFVADGGTNTNPCTTAALPCGSLGGVFSKIVNQFPFEVNKAQTITVAAGTYTEAATLDNIDVNAAITISGAALANAVPTTGTATGTLTAVTLGALTVLTDSTQTWTVNDLVGVFVTIGGVTRVVAVNTATALSLSAPFASNPAIGNAYTLQVPSTIITSATATTLSLRLAGNSGGVGSGLTVGVTGIDFINTSSSGTACNVALSNQTLSLTTSRCIQTSGAAGSAIAYRGGGSISFSQSTAKAVGVGLNISSTGAALSMNPTTNLNISNSLVQGATGVSTTSPTSVNFAGTSGWTTQTSSATSNAWNNTTSVKRSANGTGVVIFRCIDSSSTAAGYNHISGNGNPPVSSSEISLDGALIDGCPTGINLSSNAGNGQVTVSSSGAFTCTNTTTCVKVANGSRVRLPSAGAGGSLSFQDGGTDILIDGTSFTVTQLSSASPTRLPTAPTNTYSSVWQ